MINSETQPDYHRWLRSARGQEPAERVLKGGRVVNVFTGEILEADLAMEDGWIVGLGSYQGREEIDVSGKYLAPGLIDAHLHIESTMLAPPELARAVCPCGTTTMVADPHEIANVLGMPGIRYLIDTARGLPLDIRFMAPSCVPATPMETAGARLDAEDLRELITEPSVLGLAEVMDFPGVISGREDVWDKILLFRDRALDGHAPGLTGPDLSAYALAGIFSDHECFTAEEALEKVRLGLYVFIREGSGAKNLADLLPAVNPVNLRRFSFCTDDRHPEDILEEGHINHILKQAVKLGLDPVRALIMATLNPAEAYGLKDRGALVPGRKADVVVFASLDSFEVQRVFKDGRPIAMEGNMLLPAAPLPLPDWVGSMNLARLAPDDLEVEVTGPRVRVIDPVPGQLLTRENIMETPGVNGRLVADPDRDLARLCVVERHRGSGRIGHGLLKGLGLRRGALASSVAHDSHNIVVAGMSSEEMWQALEIVRQMQGGLVVVEGARVLARLPLPVAGLMSPRSAPEVAGDMNNLKKAAAGLGCTQPNPFMTLSFLALPVIPHLKLTDRGLFNVDRFEFTSLFVE